MTKSTSWIGDTLIYRLLRGDLHERINYIKRRLPPDDIYDLMCFITPDKYRKNEAKERLEKIRMEMQEGD